MNSIIILIIGIIIVVTSTIYINKELKTEKNGYDEIVKMYGEIMECREYLKEMMNEFELLIDTTIEKVEDSNTKKDNYKKSVDYSIKTPIVLEDEVKEIDLTEQVYELKRAGFNSREIAYKLNRGVREIDILLRMNKKEL